MTWHSPRLGRAPLEARCTYVGRDTGPCPRDATHLVSMLDRTGRRFTYARCTNHAAAFAHEHRLAFPAGPWKDDP